MLSRTLHAAFAAGVAAGVLLFVLQSWTTLPLIHEAERYEEAVTPVTPRSQANEPSESQLVRTAYSAAGDVLVGIGFGMLLTAVYALSGKSGLVLGILWGLAGFATFHLGPALVVPPSIPGLILAPLSQRQAEWLSAASCTGLGLAICAFGPKAAKVGGFLLLFLPRLLFPLAVSGSAIPSTFLSTLEHHFTVYVLGNFLLFWVALGALSGHLSEQPAPGNDQTERLPGLKDCSGGRHQPAQPQNQTWLSVTNGDFSFLNHS